MPFKFAMALLACVAVVIGCAPNAATQSFSTVECGEEIATRQDGPWNVAARLCFWSAYEAGRVAEFRSTRLTIEGAPVTYLYRAVGSGRVQVLIDSRLDQFSGSDWTFLDCPRLVRDDHAGLLDFGPADDCIGLPIPTGLT